MDASFTSNIGQVLSRDDISQMSDVFLLDPSNMQFLQGGPIKRNRLMVPLLLLILGAILAGFAAMMAGSAPAGQGKIFWGIAIGIMVLFLLLIVLSIRSSGQQARFDRDAKLLQATLTSVAPHERAAIVKVLNNIVAVLFFVSDLFEMFNSKDSYYEQRRAERRVGGGPDWDKYFGVKVDYQFTTPNGIQLSNRADRNRPDLKGQMLPSEGTTVLVLYLSDQEYKLL